MLNSEWDKNHIKYTSAEWIDKPSLFSQWALQFFPKNGKVLDMGCGQGQDSRFFSSNGYIVTGIDFSEEAIKLANIKTDPSKFEYIKYMQVDISTKLPFQDETFDIVYSHLALHYFTKEKTEEIYGEIHRILKVGGILAFLLNSVNDREYNTGKMIEKDYFEMYGILKRFFSATSVIPFTKGFETIVLDEQGETYKDRAVNTNNLVRGVLRKQR